MKKIVAILMTGVMLFTLFACGKDEQPETMPDAENQPQALDLGGTVIGEESVAVD